MNSYDVVDARNPLEPDVLIIGYGPIGAVYARKLIDANIDIKVLVDIGKQ